jgi:hypothetical protein
MGLKQVFQQNPDRRYIMFGGGARQHFRQPQRWLASQGKRCWSFRLTRRPADRHFPTGHLWQGAGQDHGQPVGARD